MFDTETKLTVAEARNGEEVGKFWEKWEAANVGEGKFKDKRKAGKAGAKAGKPAGPAPQAGAAAGAPTKKLFGKK